MLPNCRIVSFTNMLISISVVEPKLLRATAMWSPKHIHLQTQWSFWHNYNLMLWIRGFDKKEKLQENLLIKFNNTDSKFNENAYLVLLLNGFYYWDLSCVPASFLYIHKQSASIQQSNKYLQIWCKPVKLKSVTQ